MEREAAVQSELLWPEASASAAPQQFILSFSSWTRPEQALSSAEESLMEVLDLDKL